MLTYSLRRGNDAWLQAEPESVSSDVITVVLVHPRRSLRVSRIIVTAKDDIVTSRQSSMPALNKRGGLLSRQVSDLATEAPGFDESEMVSREVQMAKVVLGGDDAIGWQLQFPLPKKRDAGLRGYSSKFHESLPHCTLVLSLDDDDDKLVHVHFLLPDSIAMRHRRIFVFPPEVLSMFTLKFIPIPWRIEAQSLRTVPDAIWRIVWNTAVIVAAGDERGDRDPIKELQVSCEEANKLLIQFGSDPDIVARIGVAFASCSFLILRGTTFGETDQTYQLDLGCLKIDESVLLHARRFLSRSDKQYDLAWKHLSRLVREGLLQLIRVDAATFPVASFEAIRCGAWLESVFSQVADTELGGLKKARSGLSEVALRSRQDALNTLVMRIEARLEDMYLNAALEASDVFRLVDAERSTAMKRLTTCKRTLLHLGLSTGSIDLYRLDVEELARARMQIVEVSAHLKRKSDATIDFFRDLFDRIVLVKLKGIEGLEPRTIVPPYVSVLMPKRTVIVPAATAFSEDSQGVAQTGFALATSNVCFVRCASDSSKMFLVRLVSSTVIAVYSPEHKVQRIFPISSIDNAMIMQNRNMEICALCSSVTKDNEFLACLRILRTGAMGKDGKAVVTAHIFVLRLRMYDFEEMLLADASTTMVVDERLSLFVDVGCIGEFRSGALLITSRTTPQMLLLRRRGMAPVVINKGSVEKVVDGQSSEAMLDMPVLSLSHAGSEDRIIFTGARRATEHLVRDINDAGLVRTIAKAKAPNFTQKFRLLAALPCFSNDDREQLVLIAHDDTKPYSYVLNKLREGEVKGVNYAVASTQPLIVSGVDEESPFFMSFSPDPQTHAYACAWAIPSRKYDAIIWGALSTGKVESTAAQTWQFETTAWMMALSTFGSEAVRLLREVGEVNDAIFNAEKFAIANKILEETSRTFWKCCAKFPAETIQKFFSIFLHSAPNLKDVARLHSSVVQLLMQSGNNRGASYSEMESSLNVWVDLYSWPEALLEDDISSLIAMMRSGSNSIVSDATLARVFDSRNFYASLNAGLPLVMASLESSKWDARDIFRLPVIHWLARIDASSASVRPLPALALLRKTISYWEDLFVSATGWAGEKGVIPALEWMCVAHFRTVCARKKSALRALVFLDSDPSLTSTSVVDVSAPKRLLLDNVVSIFGEAFQASGSFSVSLRAVTMDTLGGLKSSVWQVEPALDFYSKGIMPPFKDATIKSQVVEPRFLPEWFSPSTPDPVESGAVRESIPSTKDKNDDEVRFNKVTAIMLYGTGSFEAAASGVYIFALASQQAGIAPTSAAMWLSVGSSGDKYVKLNHPITIELGEGEHNISIRSFSKVSDVRLAAEGPYTLQAAKLRLEKPFSAKKFPYPVAACLFATSDVTNISKRHTFDSVAARIGWILLKSSFTSVSLKEDKIFAGGTKRKQDQRSVEDAGEETVVEDQDERIYYSIVAADRRVPSLQKVVNELLDFGVDTAALLLQCFDVGAVPAGKSEFEAFLLRLRTNLNLTWRALKDHYALSLTQLERLSQNKFDLERVYEADEHVVKTIEAAQNESLSSFKHLERISSLLSAFAESVGEGNEDEGLWEATAKVESLLRAYKKTPLCDIVRFFDSELTPELRKGSELLPFFETIHTSYFFKPIWRVCVGQQAPEIQMRNIAGGLGLQMIRVHSEWKLLRGKLLDLTIRWGELEDKMNMHDFKDESQLQSAVSAFFQLDLTSQSTTEIVHALELWTVLSLLTSNYSRAAKCVPYLVGLVAPGENNAEESNAILTMLEQTGSHFASMDLELRRALTLSESVAVANQSKVMNLMSPPVILRLDDHLCEILQSSLALLLWLRKTRSDAEFASAVEMAFTKPELEVPQELWNHEKNCVDETALGYLSDVRSTLHPLIFGVEELPIVSMQRLFSALHDCLKNSTYSSSELRHRLTVVNTKRRALMQLLAGDEPTSTDSHNQLLFLQSRAACWVSSHGDEVTMQYTVSVQDGLLSKSVNKRLDRESLADLQSTLVLGSLQTHEDDLVANLANTFVEELSVFDAIHDCAEKLSRGGHLCFQEFTIRVPFGSDVALLRDSLGTLDSLVHVWSQTVSQFRADFPLLSCFTNRQIVELVSLLLQANQLRLPDVRDLVKFPALNTQTFSSVPRVDVTNNASDQRTDDDRAVELLLCRNADERDVTFYSNAWFTCKKLFKQDLISWHGTDSSVDVIKTLQACGKAVSDALGERSVPGRLSVASFPVDETLLHVASNQSAVKVTRVVSHARMVDVALTAYCLASRFPSRNDCLFCSDFVSSDSALNLVRRWEQETDPHALYCLISGNTLSFDHQREVGRALEKVVSEAKGRKCPFLIVVAAKSQDSTEESAIEVMFASTGRVSIVPLPVASLRLFVKDSFTKRGVEAVCFSSKLPGQGKTFQVRQRAYPEPVHPFRINAILSLNLLISLARPGGSRCIHIDISDSAARSTALGAILFDFIVLNGLVDEVTGHSCTWQSSPENMMRLLVELPSKAPLGELRLCHLLDPFVVAPSAETFVVDFDQLKIGMGPLDFTSLRFDGTVEGRLM